MSKTKTITLRDLGEVLAQGGLRGHTYHAWEVLRLTDSIEFNIGQRLDERRVQELCDSKAWKVTITAKQES